MTQRVKICGLTRPEDVEASIRYGADYLGFIVEAKSKRRLSIKDAAKLSLPAKGIIPRVAVTVNMDEAMLGDLVALMQPDYIQFHGDESPEHIAQVSTRYDVKTIKALPISSRDDLLTAMAYSGYVDLMLYDAKPPKNDDVRGGHGVSFDWSILSGAPLPKTWLLAGGLNPDNIGEALKTGAPILDVSSGVESEPGVKDHGLVEDLVKKSKDLRSTTRTLYYSHRLRRSIPMLSDAEYQKVTAHFKGRMADILDYRKKHKSTLFEARTKSNESVKALDVFEGLTGVRLHHAEEIYETAMSRYGRICPDCCKPFRTPRAKFCAECGVSLPEGKIAGPPVPYE